MTFPQHCSVLIVDDSFDNVFLLKFVLESAGHQVETATSGEEAIAKAQRTPPSLILLDFMMPDLDGLEVTRRLRQNDALRLVPILLITANREVGAAQASAVGVNEVLHKPLDLDQVLAKVRDWCC